MSATPNRLHHWTTVFVHGCKAVFKGLYELLRVHGPHAGRLVSHHGLEEAIKVARRGDCVRACVRVCARVGSGGMVRARETAKGGRTGKMLGLAGHAGSMGGHGVVCVVCVVWRVGWGGGLEGHADRSQRVAAPFLGCGQACQHAGRSSRTASMTRPSAHEALTIRRVSTCQPKKATHRHATWHGMTQRVTRMAAQS